MQSIQRIDWKRAVPAAIFVVGLVSFSSTHADARRGTKSFRGSGELAATSTDPNGRGKVKASAKGTNGRFEVSASKLDRKATYDVIVDGVKIATLTTSGGGSGKARLRTIPRGHDGVLGFDPRGVGVVIRNAAGHDVLFGSVVVESESGNDDGDVICCIPDDSGTECEDQTTAECAAKGGTVSTATTCAPNPCDGATPPMGGDIVCCIPDDSGAECEDRTTAECLAQGGTVVAGTSCTPNPCAAVPSTDPDIQCCLPDDSGAECEDRTAEQCTAQGGVDRGVGVCAADSCDGVTFPAGSSGGGGDDAGGDDHGGDSGSGGQDD